MGGYVARIGEMRNAYSISFGKPVRKRLLGRPRHRWENNIKLEISEIGWVGVTGCVWLRLGISGGLFCTR
jgi:hypothetical protein